MKLTDADLDRFTHVADPLADETAAAIIGPWEGDARSGWAERVARVVMANRLIAQGKIHPTLSKTYRLEDVGQAALVRHAHGGVRDGIGGHVGRGHVALHLPTRHISTLKKAILRDEVVLGAFGDAGQGLHRFDGVLAGGGFGAQHHGIAAIEHGVGHIAGLGAGGRGRVHHTL